MKRKSNKKIKPPYNLDNGERIVLIRTFKYVQRNKYAWDKLLSKYPVMVLAAEREEWENLLQQNTWPVRDIKGNVYEITPKQVGVTELWLEESAKCSYYKEGELLPVTTNLPRYFDNKWFTQKILRRFDMAIPSRPFKYIPFLGKAKEGIDELIQPFSPLRYFTSPVKNMLYKASYSIKKDIDDLSFKNIRIKDMILDVLGLRLNKNENNEEFIITNKDEDYRYVEFIIENSHNNKATYLKPAVHTGGGMGVIRIKIEDNNLYIDTSDDGLIKLLVDEGGKRTRNKVHFITKNKKKTRELTRHILNNIYFPYFFNKLGGENIYLFEEELEQPKIGRKIEFRFVVQWVGDHFESTANYAKVGASDFVANISLSGHATRSVDVLTEFIRKNWTFIPKNDARKLAEQYINKLSLTAGAVFQELLDEARYENNQNIGKDNYLCPSTMNVTFGSVDFVPTIGPNAGILFKGIEVNTGTIGIGGLSKLHPNKYKNVIHTWTDNIVNACEIAFSKTAPRKTKL